MATVKMQRGSKIADIYDSPETIAQAEKDGFVMVVEKQKTEPNLDLDSEKKETGSRKKPSRN